MPRATPGSGAEVGGEASRRELVSSVVPFVSLPPPRVSPLAARSPVLPRAVAGLVYHGKNYGSPRLGVKSAPLPLVPFSLASPSPGISFGLRRVAGVDAGATNNKRTHGIESKNGTKINLTPVRIDESRATQKR